MKGKRGRRRDSGWKTLFALLARANLSRKKCFAVRNAGFFHSSFPPFVRSRSSCFPRGIFLSYPLPPSPKETANSPLSKPLPSPFSPFLQPVVLNWNFAARKHASREIYAGGILTRFVIGRVSSLALSIFPARFFRNGDTRKSCQYRRENEER